MHPASVWRERGRRYRLEASRCERCGRTYYPPRLVCPECGGRDLQIVNLPRTGKLITHTVVRAAGEDFADDAPFAVGIVELEDGTRLTAQIVDCDFAELSEGLKVRLEFRRVKSAGAQGVIAYGLKGVPEFPKEGRHE